MNPINPINLVKDNINNVIDYVEEIIEQNMLLMKENETMKTKIEIIENEMKKLSLFVEKKMDKIKSNTISPTQMNRIKTVFDKKHKRRIERIKKKVVYDDSDFDSDDDYINMQLLQNIHTFEVTPNDTIDIKEIDVIKKLFKDEIDNINFSKK